MEKKESRNSKNSKGKLINYNSLETAAYITSEEKELSIGEKKWLLKCRIEDINLSKNGIWNKGDVKCENCPNEVFKPLCCKHCA